MSLADLADESLCHRAAAAVERDRVLDRADGTFSSNDWGALAGLRVIDFTQSLAGPYCTQILGDMGATVIKIEPVNGGDSTRKGGPFHAADTEHRHAGYFHSINRNKKSVAVDLKAKGARALILDLIADADVVVENFRAGTLEKLGLSYEEMHARNERLIYGAIRGFGDPRSGNSPYMMWPALDVVAQAMGGINGITGPDIDHPTKVGPGIGDIVPGMFLAIGILAAVVKRQTTGKGQFVDVAMIDSVLALCERIVYQWSFAKENPGPVGNHHPFTAPFGTYPAKDGHVAIGAVFDRFFFTMCRELDAGELIVDERFATDPARRVNRLALVEELSKVTARFTKAELMERLGGKVPFGPVYSMAEIAEDPHFAARGMLPELHLDGLPEPVAVAGTPIKMSETPGGVHAPGSPLGADTDAVLAELGYSAEKITGLRAEGVII